MSEEEMIDRYSRELNPYVWKEMCTTEHEELSEAMADAERIEAVHRRVDTKKQKKIKYDTPDIKNLVHVQRIGHCANEAGKYPVKRR